MTELSMKNKTLSPLLLWLSISSIITVTLLVGVTVSASVPLRGMLTKEWDRQSCYFSIVLPFHTKPCAILFNGRVGNALTTQMKD